MGVPLLFFCNYAVQRGNGYDLPDNADNYRSGGRADVTSCLLVTKRKI